ncbi:hypothetical protein V6Z93_000210 [Aspergillus fumigatus]
MTSKRDLSGSSPIQTNTDQILTRHSLSAPFSSAIQGKTGMSPASDQRTARLVSRNRLASQRLRGHVFPHFFTFFCLICCAGSPLVVVAVVQVLHCIIHYL